MGGLLLECWVSCGGGGVMTCLTPPPYHPPTHLFKILEVVQRLNFHLTSRTNLKYESFHYCTWQLLGVTFFLCVQGRGGRVRVGEGVCGGGEESRFHLLHSHLCPYFFLMHLKNSGTY